MLQVSKIKDEEIKYLRSNNEEMQKALKSMHKDLT